MLKEFILPVKRDYRDILAEKMAMIPINKQEVNAVFIHKGNYSVRTFKGDEVSFDEAIDRMNRYNESSDSVGRCIFITAPNVILRGFGDNYADSMITYCAPMKNPANQEMRAKSGDVGWDYAIPDRRDVAADIVSMDNDLLSLAEAAISMELAVEIDGKTPFEGAPL